MIARSHSVRAVLFWVFGVAAPWLVSGHIAHSHSRTFENTKVQVALGIWLLVHALVVAVAIYGSPQNPQTPMTKLRRITLAASAAAYILAVAAVCVCWPR
jgi:hypothetical protein